MQDIEVYAKKDVDVKSGPIFGPTTGGQSNSPGVEGSGKLVRVTHPVSDATLGVIASKAYVALLVGRLEPLAFSLCCMPTGLDSRLAKQLANMIDGTVAETGYRLKVGKHPSLASGKRGREVSR